MPALEVRGLVVRYGPVVAVRGVDLTLEEGQVAVVLGANGAGKTSTLNAVCGAVPIAEGEVIHHGRTITGWPSHRVSRGGLMEVPEGRRIIGPLTVEENLLLGAHHVRSRARREALLAEIYDMFPVLETRKHGPGGLLSGGEQQMLAFGRALMAEPRTLLLDEPSMGLAPSAIDRVIETVRAIAARGISILMVEQNANAAFEVASFVYVLEQGEVILAGKADEVKGHPLVVRAFLGLEEAPAAEEVAGRS